MTAFKYVAVLLSFFIVASCKKTSVAPEKGTLSAFSVINVYRGNDSAIINWAPVTFTTGSGTVKYTVQLDNGFQANIDTATR